MIRSQIQFLVNNHAEGIEYKSKTHALDEMWN